MLCLLYCVVKRLYSTHVTRGATRPSPVRCGVSVVRVIYERGGRHARPAAVARWRSGGGAAMARRQRHTSTDICGPVYAGDSPPPRAAIASHSRRYLGAAEGALQCASPRTPPTSIQVLHKNIREPRFWRRCESYGAPIPPPARNYGAPTPYPTPLGAHIAFHGGLGRASAPQLTPCPTRQPRSVE